MSSKNPKKDANYCKGDYLGQHCWKHLGVYPSKNIIYEVWKCTQCKKCMKKKLEFVEDEK